MKDSRPVAPQPRIIAVTGGKGGVGKTSIAINLALVLAREGQRVLLLDGDMDLANVAIMLGQYPKQTLEHVLRRECTLDEVIMEAPLGLHVIPGASGVQPHYLGAIWRDETLRQSVITQRPVALMAESDPSCRQFRSLADMVKVRLEQLPTRKSGIAAYWYQAVRKSEQNRSTVESSTSSVTPATPMQAPSTPLIASATSIEETAQLNADPATRVRQTVAEFGDLLSDPSVPSMLRHEAFAACFALLGRTMDDGTVESIQTGLSALDWEALNIAQRAHLATYFRDLAGQVAPGLSKPEAGQAGIRNPAREPRYDQVIFGDQQRLLEALREQPGNISLDHFLRGLASNADNPFEG